MHSLELFCYVSGVFIEDVRLFLKIEQKLGTYWTQTLIIRWALLNKDRYSMKTINITVIFILENENSIKRCFLQSLWLWLILKISVKANI